MPRPRWSAGLIAAGVFAAQPGCVTLYSETEAVRGDEPRRAVRFECPQAAERFQEAVAKTGRTVGGTYVGVPFVTLYSRRERLSEAARWNDAATQCDADQDGTITAGEAEAFAKAVKQ